MEEFDGSTVTYTSFSKNFATKEIQPPPDEIKEEKDGSDNTAFEVKC